MSFESFLNFRIVSNDTGEELASYKSWDSLNNVMWEASPKRWLKDLIVSQLIKRELATLFQTLKRSEELQKKFLLAGICVETYVGELKIINTFNRMSPNDLSSDLVEVLERQVFISVAEKVIDHCSKEEF